MRTLTAIQPAIERLERKKGEQMQIGGKTSIP
jgi:hypothetical protein